MIRTQCKLVLIGILIGILAGFAAMIFSLSIQISTDFFLGTLVNYLPPDTIEEGKNKTISWKVERFWLLPIVTMLGGLLSGILVHMLAKETKGHGTDAAIEAYHQGKRIRTRVPIIKMITSAITIGAGGSAGKEGPIAQIGAGIGSTIGSLLKLKKDERRLALVIGMGAGIGAIFHAPIGGAIVATEFLYKEDMERRALIPSIIASIVGYSIYQNGFGFHPYFQVSASFTFTVQEVFLIILLGILCGILGLIYIHSFYNFMRVFDQWKIPAWLKPGIGGLFVGILGIFFPQILGLGDGWLQEGMKNGLSTLPLWIVCLLPLLKILATSLSVGSGGSGGIFGPGMITGGFLGIAVWTIYQHLFPETSLSPSSFAIVGMIALFAGVAHAPIGMILLGLEMSNSFSMIIPATLASCISLLIVGKQTIYKKQRETKARNSADKST